MGSHCLCVNLWLFPDYTIAWFSWIHIRIGKKIKPQTTEHELALSMRERVMLVAHSLDTRESTIVRVIMNILATSNDSATACTFLDIWKSNQTQSQRNSRFTRAWLTEQILFYFADRWAITLRTVKLFGIKIDRGGRKKKNTYLNLSLRFNDSLLLRTTCWEGWFYSLTKLQSGLPLVYHSLPACSL